MVLCMFYPPNQHFRVPTESGPRQPSASVKALRIPPSPQGDAGAGWMEPLAPVRMMEAAILDVIEFYGG